MATFRHNNIGARVSTTPGDSSWDAANSYAPASTVPLNNANNDTILWDDDALTLTAALNDQGNANTGNTVTIDSRSGDKSGCTLTAQADNRAFQFNDTTNVHTYTVQNITLTGAMTFTGGSYAVLIGTDTGNVTFSSVSIDGFSGTASVSAGTGWLVNESGTARTVTFTNSTLDSNNIGNTNEFGGAVRTTNALTLTDTQANLNTISSQATTNGLLHCNGDVTAAGLKLNNNTVTSGTTSDVAYALLNCQGNNTASIVASEINNNTMTNGQVHGYGIYCEGAYNVSIQQSTGNLVVSSDNCLGGAFVSYGANATGIYRDSVVYSNTVKHGAGFYNSQGGGGTVKRLKAYSNTSIGRDGIEAGGGGGLYSGGWGDLTIESSLFYSNHAQEGAGIYGHNHASLSTRNKTITINNCTITENVRDSGGVGATGGSGAAFENGNGTYSLDVDFVNCIITENTGDLQVETAGAGTLNLTMTNCYVAGDAATEAPDFTQTNEQTLDPLLTSDYRLGTDSPAKGAGKFVSWQDRDVRGRRRSVPPSLGAYEPTSGDPADTRALATVRLSRT